MRLGLERERDIERSILDYLTSKNIFCWKNQTTGYFDPYKKIFRKQVSKYSLNGVPDILCISKGKFIGIEIKSKVGKQSPSQKEFQNKCENNGGTYLLIRSLEEMKKFM